MSESSDCRGSRLHWNREQKESWSFGSSNKISNPLAKSVIECKKTQLTDCKEIRDKGKEIKKSNRRGWIDQVKYTHSGNTLRNPFEHHSHINNKK
jgi:uncharacterized protein YhfF